MIVLRTITTRIQRAGPRARNMDTRLIRAGGAGFVVRIRGHGKMKPQDTMVIEMKIPIHICIEWMDLEVT